MACQALFDALGLSLAKAQKRKESFSTFNRGDSNRCTCIDKSDEDLPLIRRYFTEVFQIKLDIQAVVTVADLRIVRSLVSLGQGYTVLPKYLCEQQLQTGNFSLLHQTELNPSNKLYLVWNKYNLRHPRVVYTRDHLLKIL